MKNAVISDPVIGDLKKMLQDAGRWHESFGLYPACPILIFRRRDNKKQQGEIIVKKLIETIVSEVMNTLNKKESGTNSRGSEIVGEKYQGMSGGTGSQGKGRGGGRGRGGGKGRGGGGSCGK